MRLRVSSLSHCSCYTVAMAMLLVMPLYTALAAPSNTGGAEFDIPISELNKVKKKAPTKRANGETKKKKKNAAKPQESSSSVTAPSEPAGQVHAQPVASHSASQHETSHHNSPDADKALPGSEIRIHHTPYSFVVAGKHTVIHAVISSKADIKEVMCSVGAAESGALTQVKMEKVNGSQFTYVADLPALPHGISALRYTIDTVDSQGGKTRSKEFVTPVASSPLVPSWQTESADDAVSTGQEEGKKPQPGISDPAVPR